MDVIPLSDFLTKQIESRQRAWSEAREMLDLAATENRDLSAEERQKYDRINADLDERAQFIKDVQAAEARESDIAKAMEGREAAVRPMEAPAAAGDESILRALLRGEIRTHTFDFERRDVLTSSSNAPTKSTFSDMVIEQARLVGPMLDPNVVTVLNTGSGENLVLPSLSSYSTAALVAEAGSIGESDPVFSRTTLSAYKYSFLVQVSNEFINDSAVDLLGFVAQQAGNEIGYRANSVLTTGTGTVQPNGIASVAGSGVTGSTAVTGAFTGDNLISLIYSVDGAARRMPGFGVMANATSIAAMRSLKASTSGDYLFTPTLDAATPDRFLGYPLIENPHMASPGTSNKSVLAGHLPSYYTRQVGGIQVASSTDYAFQNDLVTIRCIIRVDGNLPQTSHVKYFRGAAT
jgi:HK97 family phage major capsid protein